MERPLTVLLVEDDPEPCAVFRACIDGEPDISLVGTTGNEEEALALIQDYLPDVIVLDLELENGAGDGLLLLQKLRRLSLPAKPYVLVTTNNPSKATHRMAHNTGADYVMVKYQKGYSPQLAVDFLKVLAENGLKQETTPDGGAAAKPLADYEKRLITRIHTELDHVGVSPKAVGYDYLTRGIRIVMDGPVPNLCALIAKDVGKTEASVERAMQNAINRAWATADVDDLLKYYTGAIHSDKGVPTLTEFIYYYAKKLKTEY